ncbi:hypothetical protein Tco_1198545, partial [Tanacetum coccineum]
SLEKKPMKVSREGSYKRTKKDVIFFPVNLNENHWILGEGNLEYVMELDYVETLLGSTKKNDQSSIRLSSNESLELSATGKKASLELSKVLLGVIKITGEPYNFNHSKKLSWIVALNSSDSLIDSLILAKVIDHFFGYSQAVSLPVPHDFSHLLLVASQGT